VDGLVPDPARHEPDGAAGENAEFQVMAADSSRPQRKLDQIMLVLETERIRHGTLDIIDAALLGAQGALAHRMNAADIRGLIEAADDLVHDVFQTKIRDQHYFSSNS
jgi:hypothetical protein